MMDALSSVTRPLGIIDSIVSRKVLICSSLSTISMIIGRSVESCRILVVCRRRVFGPKPIGPRSTVAPASPISRAFNTSASYSGRPRHLSSSPTKIRSSTASWGGTCIPNLLAVHRDAGDVAEPGADQAEEKRQRNVDKRGRPLVVQRQIEGLQAER